MGDRILVISCTNRVGSRTRVVAEIYKRILDEKGVNADILSLEDLPPDFLVSNMYGASTADVNNLVETKIKTVDKYVFVMPEYNGGFPGVLKLFIDGISPVHFYGKKAALVGISSGRQGNTRGMDAFTNVLNYIQVSVLFRKPKLSGIEALLKDDGTFADITAWKSLQQQAEEFIHF